MNNLAPWISIVLTAVILIVASLLKAITTTKALDDLLVSKRLLAPAPARWTDRSSVWRWQRVATRAAARKRGAKDTEVVRLARTARQWSWLAICLLLLAEPAAQVLKALVDPVLALWLPAFEAIRLPIAVTGAFSVAMQLGRWRGKWTATSRGR